MWTVKANFVKNREADEVCSIVDHISPLSLDRALCPSNTDSLIQSALRKG